MRLIDLVISGISAFTFTALIFCIVVLLIVLSPIILFLTLWHYRYIAPKVTYETHNKI